MPPTNLPHDLSSFLGRDAELAGIIGAIDSNRLVVLTGAGGVGKTRVSLKAARDRADAYPDGTWLIELAAVSHGAGVPVAVARVLNMREEASVSLTETLARELSRREMLLVFDNCEQVADGCAALIETLLKAAPKVRVLATSRESLGVRGEALWPLQPMTVAEGTALFCDRARLGVPDYAPSTGEVEAIAAIVARLDGLPLAIELAAARIRMMSAFDILAGLDGRFQLLTQTSRLVMDHHKTLEASVAWSYDLLEPAEQELCRRLSVLHGFELETAEALGDCAKGGTVFDLLSRLADKSLVQVDHSGPRPRFRFLETVRQYLLDRLHDAGALEEMRDRHLMHFLDLAEALAPGLALRDGPACLGRLEAEYGNLEDALRVADAAMDKTMLLRLVVALGLFFELRGHFAFGWRWCQTALKAHPEQSVLRARTLWVAAHVCFYGGRYAEAVSNASEAHATATAVNDPWSQARALNTIGVLESLATPILARETLLQSVAIGRAIGDDWAVADGLKMVSVAWYFLHDHAGAQNALSDLETAGNSLESRFFLAWHQALVGYFARDSGDLATAAEALKLSLEHSDFVGDPSTGGFSEAWSAALDADQGRIARACDRLNALLESAAVSGSDLAVPEALFALGQIELGEGNPTKVLDLIGHHVAELRDAGVPGLAAQLAVVEAAAHCDLGALDEADRLLTEAESMAEPLNHPLIKGLVRYERARLALAKGAEAEALNWLHAALDLQSAAGLRPGLLRTLEAIAALIARRDRNAEAARIHFATQVLRGRIGIALNRKESAAISSLEAHLGREMGTEAFEALKAGAAQIEWDEIVEYVSRARGKRGRPLSGWESLTPTERRVVSLVVEGLTNPQIAERMFIARGTVKIHLAHVFDKLGVTSRTQLATEAITEGA